jgi:CheY-like chemotaxis protein
MEPPAETDPKKNSHILLVEDDLEDVKMILAALKDNDWANQVIVVRDGAEALDYLYRRGTFRTRPGGAPILVLLDNKMPKVSGLQVLRTIKADDQLKMIPVVALTSSGLASDLVEFYKHGVNAYVVKPVGFSEFVMAIKRIGSFWMTVNEPPPATWGKEVGVQNGNGTFSEKERSAT